MLAGSQIARAQFEPRCGPCAGDSVQSEVDLQRPQIVSRRARPVVLIGPLLECALAPWKSVSIRFLIGTKRITRVLRPYPTPRPVAGSRAPDQSLRTPI